ncbi:hypothetical protein QBC36DRAFT_192116 [Triangularia setosa]|uniref:Uncharacterized protein n=1 Tax=Triangularia setosa TaxID=2587417 RepID=A0AAN7A5Y6_9PEZI|nr:hypothetical protein QBC36DRAFT_192116 [Podospora setosa]
MLLGRRYARLCVFQHQPLQLVFAADDQVDDALADENASEGHFLQKRHQVGVLKRGQMDMTMGTSQPVVAIFQPKQQPSLGLIGHPKPAHPDGQLLELGQVLKEELVHATYRVGIALHLGDHFVGVAIVHVGDNENNLKEFELGEIVLPRLRLEYGHPARVPIFEHRLSRRDALIFGYFVKGVAPEPADGEVGLTLPHVTPAQL